MQFLDSATRIAEEYQKLIGDLSPNSNETRGRIRLGTVASLAKSLVPHIIVRLAAEYPHLEIRLVTDSGWRLVRMLDAGDLDVVLGVHQEQELENIVAYPLFDLGMYWLSRPGLLEAEGPLVPSDLLAVPIISTEIGSSNHMRMMDYLGVQASDATTFHYSNSYSSTANLVEAGIGISVLPPVMVQDQLRAGRLVALDLHPRYPVMKYYILRQKNPAAPMSRLFVRAARQAAEETAGYYSRDLILMTESD